MRELVVRGELGAKSGRGFSVRGESRAGQGLFPAPRPDAGQEGPVRLESRGEVAIAWLDSPPANSITPAMIAALRAAFDAVAVPGGRVRALVIASANPALFCAGADIRAMAAMDTDAAAAFTAAMHALLLDFERSRIVTVAAVGGLAYGGGCELAMGADVRIAARSASFGQPEVKLGIMTGFGGTQRLPRLVGLAKALEMNLTGEPIEAEDAWQHGLVHRVVADHELLDAALAWARRLAAQPSLAVEQIKRATNGADLEAGARLERAAFAEVIASTGAREGIAAFLEKRPARFGGA
jgi:enoyl-CoA hydratase/carnithine racemase